MKSISSISAEDTAFELKRAPYKADAEFVDILEGLHGGGAKGWQEVRVFARRRGSRQTEIGFEVKKGVGERFGDKHIVSMHAFP